MVVEETNREYIRPSYRRTVSNTLELEVSRSTLYRPLKFRWKCIHELNCLSATGVDSSDTRFVVYRADECLCFGNMIRKSKNILRHASGRLVPVGRREVPGNMECPAFLV